MGLLSIFKKDWVAEIDRAVRYLEDEQPVLALELLQKIEARVEGPNLERAQELSATARTALFDSLLERAETSEGEGKLEDAADWLLAAIERCTDPDLANSLKTRRQDLLDELEINPFAERNSSAAGPDEPAAEGSDEEVEIHFDAIVETLVPSVAELYRDRSHEFKSLIVALNQGEVEHALQGLDELIDSSDGQDPVLRLERGRAHLLDNDLETAREDFEAVWDALGADPLDSAGVLSIPVLWAETVIAEDPETVAQRLAELAKPNRATAEVATLYAQALLKLEDYEHALPYLQSMLRRYPSNVSFALLLAQSLVAGNQITEAIECLEAAIGPSCSGGRCTAGPRHVPAIRTLAELHLRLEGSGGVDTSDASKASKASEDRAAANPERCAELMAIVAQTQGGLLGAADHAVLGRYYRAIGDEPAAEHAEAEAVRLATLGPESEAAPANLGTGHQRVL